MVIEDTEAHKDKPKEIKIKCDPEALQVIAEDLDEDNQTDLDDMIED